MTRQNTGMNNHWVNQSFYPNTETGREYGIYSQYYDYSSGSYAYYEVPYLQQNIFYPVQHQWIPPNASSSRYMVHFERNHRFCPEPTQINQVETVALSCGNDPPVTVNQNNEPIIQYQETCEISTSNEKRKKKKKTKKKKSDKANDLTKCIENVSEKDKKFSDGSASSFRGHHQINHRFRPEATQIVHVDAVGSPHCNEPSVTVNQSSESIIQSQVTSETLTSNNKKKREKWAKKNNPHEAHHLGRCVTENMNENDKKLGSKVEVTPEKTKSVHFSEEENNKKSENSNNATTVLDYSRLFAKTKSKTKDPWPKLNKTEDHQLNEVEKKPQMNFTEKVKNSPSLERPFLDWRDQRKSNEKASQPVKNKEQAEEKSVVNSVEQSQKEKERRQRRRMKEKEKKKRIREEKALAEKLAPKSQKVKLISTEIMEKYKQSTMPKQEKPKAVTGRSNISQELGVEQNSQGSVPEMPTAQNRLVLTSKDYPELRKVSRPLRVVSESESEWETTEVVVVPAQPLVEKNVKRKDPIQLDLLALIQQKQKRLKEIKSKVTVGSANSKKKKSVGVVANILDRNAPVLSRGKIRNKKRKVSGIRRALLKWKEKKKQMTDDMRKQLQVEGSRQPKLHSKKFREYCDQMLTDDIDTNARDMLFHLRMFQDRAYQMDPIKGRMRKRLVAGLREVTKQVERNRVKIVFLAPDIERCAETGGLDEAVEHLLKAAHGAQVPIVYALSRRKIGRVLKKNVPVSCCGVLNFQGTEETWNKLKLLVEDARTEYSRKAQQLGLTSTDPDPEPGVEGKLAHEQEQPQLEKPMTVVTGGLLNLLKLSLKDEQVN